MREHEAMINPEEPALWRVTRLERAIYEAAKIDLCRKFGP